MAKLWFFYGAMGASKSAQAIMTWYNYEERGQKCLISKSGVDTRDGDRIIKSRIGLKAECILVEELCQMTNEQIKAYNAVVVDEAQFCTKEQIAKLADIVDYCNIPVLCYGLRTTSTNELFEGSMWLLAWADEIKEIKSVCWCGNGAMHNARFDETGNIVKHGAKIQLGGNDCYTSLCRKHYNEGLIRNPNQK